MTGLHLSHYAIESELGRGGMGIVFRAKDTKLNRTVALKVLPAGALASEDDRARFRREAQAAAQLNHPNVCHVYQVDEAQPLTPDGKPVDGQIEPRLFIAMEYIEGQTLHDYVQKGPLKLQEAVNIAGQVAEALKEAHAKDIVHRDIKSANIMLTEGGVAKVLDFGLAKTNQSTMLTRMGSTLGTVAYMSPEQARGQEVDGRSDLYSLGTMLYEMVAGRLPYTGDYEQAVLYGILNEPPEPLTAVRTGIPMQLEWIVSKLLAKEAEYRYQSAAGLLADLKSLDLSGSGRTARSMPAMSAAVGPGTPAAGPGGIPKWTWGVGGALLLAGIVIGWLARPTPPPPPDQPPAHFSISLPNTENLRAMGGRSVAISPDGATVAYIATGGVRLRHMNDPDQAITLAGPQNPRELLFSPDSEWLAYEERSGNRIMRVQLAGGSPVPIADLAGDLSGMSWGGDGYIYLGLGNAGLGRVSGGGGVVEMLPVPVDSTGRSLFRAPGILPDGRTVMYSYLRDGNGNWDEAEIRFLDLRTERDWLFHQNGRNARYVPTGHIVFEWNGSLYAKPFDAARLEETGSQVPVSSEVAARQFDVSDNGTLLKTLGFGSFSGTRLDWVSPDGTLSSLNPDFRSFEMPRVQPTGRLVAVGIDGQTWLFDGVAGTSNRLTDAGIWPVWSSNGEQLAYSLPNVGVLSRRISIPDVVDTLLADTRRIETTDWSPDGRHIALAIGPTAASSDIHILDVESGEVRTFLENDFDVDFARFSPDGNWVAYESREIGDRDEVFVRRFPGAGDLLRVSQNGGSKAIWRQDGQAVYYTNGAGQIEETEVLPEAGTVGSTRVVYSGPIETIFGFDVHPDGRLLVRSLPSSDGGLAADGGMQLDLVFNWFTELRARQ